MLNYIDGFLGDAAAINGEGDSVLKDFLGNAWMEVLKIKYSECMLVLVWYVFEPFDSGQGVLRLVYHGMSLYSGADFVKDLLANTCYFILCWAHKLQVGLFWTSSLWSFKVTYACFSAVHSALSCTLDQLQSVAYR